MSRHVAQVFLTKQNEYVDSPVPCLESQHLGGREHTVQ